MKLTDYLHTLSKDELISLVNELAASHGSVKAFLQKKCLENQKEVLPAKVSLSLDSNLVTRLSTPQEKINLYKSLFIGRQDVFALRWHNAKSGKSGYSPVCANKFAAGKCDLKKHNCATCPYKLPVALNDGYIFNHLAGRDELCRDVIGLYPLMEGNLCRFLAIDFDSHDKKIQTSDWKSDILAVHRACSDFAVSSYIEISRSGNGGHLWIFFAESIPARLARNFGSALIKSAMQNRHSIPFESFDRFFPNQDEIPNGGYGNLIALPLQGRAVKEGHSVFVDENFNPYDDPWKFLSSVQKIFEKELKKAINQIESNLGDFVEKDESDKKGEFSAKINSAPSLNSDGKEKLSEGDFSEIIQIRLSNYVKIKKQGISERALGILRRTAVFMNPQYFKNLRMHLPLYNIPRYIDCSKENDEFLLLPRGNLQKVIEKISEASPKYQITDERENGTAINLAFTLNLYDEQQEALKALLKSDIGILSAGTGFGKTVVATALIAARNTNTLVLVQSHALLEQWRKSIKDFLGFTSGTIAAGKDKSTGIIDIAIVNSLVEKQSDEIKPRSHKYGMLIVDEAHHVSAFSTENLVSSFSAKYVYGLTATPIRRDGLQKIIFYQCGAILYSTTAKQMNQSQGFEHFFIPRFTNFHYVPELAKAESKNPSINIFYENLIANQARNELIIQDVKNAVEVGRCPLVLSERIEHLSLLYAELKGFAQNVIFITGKGTQKQKKELLEKLRAVPKDESLIVLATGKYAGEGFDEPRLDTLMLAMPFSWKGTLAQYCGRLHRNFSGKEEVQIYDYVDYRLPIFDRMYQNRLKGYKQLGYSIKSDCSDSPQENTNAKLYSTEDYKTDFEKDIAASSSRIVIAVPYLSKYNVQAFVSMAEKRSVKGVRIQISACKPNDESKQKKLLQCVKILEDAGVQVALKDSFSQKIAIIDEKILWYGSVNFLGYTETDECCMRIINAQIASEVEGEIGA